MAKRRTEKVIAACVGCGSKTWNHPFVAVVVTSIEPKAAEARPVCAVCYSNPAHRTTPIKGHFFAAHRAAEAVAACVAPGNDIVG